MHGAGNLKLALGIETWPSSIDRCFLNNMICFVNVCGILSIRIHVAVYVFRY